MTLKEKETYSQINECVALIYQQRTMLIIEMIIDILAVPTIYTKMQHNFFHYFFHKIKGYFHFFTHFFHIYFAVILWYN